MINITKEEAEYLRKNGRGEDVHMSSKTHKSKYKSYFLTTSYKSMKLLNDYRNKRLLGVFEEG